MNKKTFFTMILGMLISVILTACAGLGDWELKLPNNYELWRVNSENIVIEYKDTEFSLTYTNANEEKIGIDEHINEFCYNDRFVGTKHIATDDNSKKENHQGSSKFYLLDTKEQKVYGPFEKEEDFDKKCRELSVEKLTKWEKTNPAPKGAKFPE